MQRLKDYCYYLKDINSSLDIWQVLNFSIALISKWTRIALISEWTTVMYNPLWDSVVFVLLLNIWLEGKQVQKKIKKKKKVEDFCIIIPGQNHYLWMTFLLITVEISSYAIFKIYFADFKDFDICAIVELTNSHNSLNHNHLSSFHTLAILSYHFIWCKYSFHFTNHFHFSFYFLVGIPKTEDKSRKEDKILLND